jgi:3-dehydroquinate dehydratase
MIIEQRLATTMIILFSVLLLMAPTVYAAIEKVEKYAENICIQTFKGDWDGKDCDIQEAEDEQKYYDDIASLEDSICKEVVKDVSPEDLIDLCKNLNVFEK